jgi:hypothetical protein
LCGEQLDVSMAKIIAVEVEARKQFGSREEACFGRIPGCFRGRVFRNLNSREQACLACWRTEVLKHSPGQREDQVAAVPAFRLQRLGLIDMFQTSQPRSF